MSVADYAELQRILVDAKGLTDAAEAHGTLAGALCAAGSYGLDDWLGEILPDSRADQMTRECCRAYFDATARALGGIDMSFEVLLPGDEQPPAPTLGTDAILPPPPGNDASEHQHHHGDRP